MSVYHVCIQYPQSIRKISRKADRLYLNRLQRLLYWNGEGPPTFRQDEVRECLERLGDRYIHIHTCMNS